MTSRPVPPAASPEYLLVLARKCTRHYLRRKGVQVDDSEVDSMVSDAVLAGIRADTRWRPNGGASLFTFLWRRMSGALIDEYRLGISGDRAMHGALRVDSLPADGEDGRLRDIYPPQQEAGYSQVEDAGLVDWLLQCLSDREREVIVRYYWQGETLAAIGESFGVTESRICQIRTRAVARMRTAAEQDAG